MSRTHVQNVSSGNLYDRDAEPNEQARLCSGLFDDAVIVAAGKIRHATSVFVGLRNNTILQQSQATVQNLASNWQNRDIQSGACTAQLDI